MKPVEKEILAATGEPERREKEAVQTYLARVARAMNKLEEEAWDKLSDDAQTWYNGAAKAVKAKGAIELMPGMEDDAESGADAETDKNKPARGAKEKDAPAEGGKDKDKSKKEKEAPVETKKPVKETKEKEAPPEKPKLTKDKTKSDKSEQSKRGEAGRYFRVSALKHEDWSFEKVYAHVKEKGHDIAEAGAGGMFWAVHNQLKLMRELEMIPAKK